MINFIQKWHELRKEKGSNICAGLDPAVFQMGRGDKGLPKGVGKLEWCLDFIETVAPYIVCIKPNAGYFGGVDGRAILKEITGVAQELNLLTIIDAKVSDIGSTSDSYIYDYKELGFDCVTIAPYAGNMEGLIESGNKNNIAVITMGLMSNPEYKTEMNFKDEDGKALWESRVERGLVAGVDGFVVGGTYTKDDPEFMKFIELTKDSNALYLVPGIGTQGGKVNEFLASGIDPSRCIISSTRGLMFPCGSASTSQEQAQATKTLRDDFNKNCV